MQAERIHNALHHTRRKGFLGRALYHLVEQREAVAIVAKLLAGRAFRCMRQEVAHTNRVGPGQSDSVVANRIIQFDQPLLDELQHDRGSDGLRERREMELRLWRDRPL